ncbi:hypothetical protein BGX38DRAFT_1265867 [Terfezia claveryi]|nr:hypothetical protein BGX38DRAFT_1265867 [Terfezia claveryi]
MFSAISATNITAIHWADETTANPIDNSDLAETIFDSSSDPCIEEEPDTDNIEYLAYNTTDDEDNNSSDLSSVPASTTDGEIAMIEVDKVLEDSNDDEEDEDYVGIISNQIVHQYSQILRESKPKGTAKGKEDSSAKG